MMDIPQIGAHCSLTSCNILDFLPITCYCNKSFCSNHISPELHHCPALDARTSRDLPTLSGSDPQQRCVFDGCQRPRLRIYNDGTDETCTACHQSFCVEHRHPETHKCPIPNVEPTSSSSLKPSSSTRFKPLYRQPRSKPPTDPAKLAQWQKIEVMKMRHRASPGDPKDNTASLPPDQRVHVKVSMEQAERIFWFRKTVVTGRALDLLIKQLNLSFPENQALKLSKVSQSDDGEGPVFLHNDQLLVSQVEDGSCLVICQVT